MSGSTTIIANPPPDSIFKARYLLSINGSIESISTTQYKAHRLAYYIVPMNPKFSLISGVDMGISQTSIACSTNEGNTSVLSLPICLSYINNSGNGPLGWPSLVIEAYGLTKSGLEEVCGYGYARVPITSGSQHITIKLFQPYATEEAKKSGLWTKIFGFSKSTVTKSEFHDCRLLADTLSRSNVATVSYGGVVEVDLEVAIM